MVGLSICQAKSSGGWEIVRFGAPYSGTGIGGGIQATKSRMAAFIETAPTTRLSAYYEMRCSIAGDQKLVPPSAYYEMRCSIAGDQKLVPLRPTM